jgi:hypothetical protein
LKRSISFILFFLTFLFAGAQPRYSVSTELTLLRNFSPSQKFYAVGQTIQGNIHFSRKGSLYLLFDYFSEGKFTNTFSAGAKQQQTVPSAVSYEVTGRWRYRHYSVGYKHFFFGTFDGEETIWNVYGVAGFGLLYVKAANTFSQPLDTALYTVSAPVQGEGEFNRLTFDVGIGVEKSVGGAFFIYGEARTWIPASDYPSPLLHNNEGVPRPLIISGGLRILFGHTY